MNAVDRWREAWASNDPEAIGEAYADDALMDANVPHWRFQVQGREAIVEQLREWGRLGVIRVAGWQQRATEWGAVVEEESFVGEGPDERYFRVLHCFVTAGDRIVEHVSYCTGVWDKATLERQRAEASAGSP